MRRVGVLAVVLARATAVSGYVIAGDTTPSRDQGNPAPVSAITYGDEVWSTA